MLSQGIEIRWKRASILDWQSNELMLIILWPFVGFWLFIASSNMLFQLFDTLIQPFDLSTDC